MFVVGIVIGVPFPGRKRSRFFILSTIFSTALFAFSGNAPAYAEQKPENLPYSLENVEVQLMQPEAFPSTGTITASSIGNGVWWRPEMDETSITLMLHNLGEWGISNVYIDVFRSGHTLFPSDVLPQQPDATGRDWLQHIIAEAHNHNIRVHAWAQVLCWHEPNAGAGSTHPLLLNNAHWLQVTADGQASDGATAARFVSPASPEVRKVLLSMAEELCRYPIDGFNLDAMHYNHRFDAGYADYSTNNFQKLYGVDPTELSRNLDRDSDWMKWVSYREDQLTSIVQLLSDKCRQAGEANERRILVSINVHPAYEETRGINRRYQHWGQWVTEALVDATIPQCFNPDLPGLERQLWEARSVHMGSRVACVPGLLLSSETTGNRPTLEEQRRLLGNTGFQYCTVMDYQALLREKTEPATAPEENDNDGFWGFLRGNRDQK